MKTFRSTEQWKRYKYLRTRYTNACVNVFVLANSRRNKTVTVDDREYQQLERSRLALDSFVLATMQLNGIIREVRDD